MCTCEKCVDLDDPKIISPYNYVHALSTPIALSHEASLYLLR